MDEKDLKTIVDDLQYLASEKDRSMILNILVGNHPADIAKIIANLSDDNDAYVFSLLDTDTASDVLVEFDDHTREKLVSELKHERLSELVDEMDSDDATDLVAELPEDVAERVLESIDEEDSEEVKELLRHEEDSAGGIMALEFVSVSEDMTVDGAIREIRKKAEEVEEVYNVYVVDKEGKLIGVLPLKKLILAHGEQSVQNLMNKDVVSVPTDMDQEEVAKVFRHYNLVSVPVVDSEGKLVGRITVDDVVDVMEEEASEDILRMGGVDEEDRVFSSPLHSIKMRLPWLFVNLFTAVLAASIVALFQDAIDRVVALAVLMPIVAGMGGNAGTQTLTVIVRGLAVGELTFARTRKALMKELLVGLGNGFSLGAVTSLLAYLWGKNPFLGVILGMAMVTNMFVAAAAGTLIPILLKWLKIDPALASGVFVTTLTDVCGFFSFLGLATLFIAKLL